MTEIHHTPSTFRSFIKKVVFFIAVIMSIVQIYAASSGSFATVPLRSMHLGFVLVLIYLQKIAKRTGPFWGRDLIDLAFCLVSSVVCVYAYFTWEAMMMEVAFPSDTQLLVGIILIFIVLDGCRRTLGYAIPVIALIFILYGMLGQYIPLAGHRGYSLERIVGHLTMTTEGIYGSVLGVSATYIFLFVLFGSFLEQSGASSFFINLSLALFGRRRGGPAKVGTIASGLFGMVSGSAVANVMSVGPLTIPLMTKLGFPLNFSGGIISVSGTGGQLMPPVMGAAAFIIAETLQISYLRVCLAAFIPSVLYYMSLWFIIDCRAQSRKIEPLPDEEIPDWKIVLFRGFYLALPVILLVVFLVFMGWSPLKAGLWSIVSLVVVAAVRKETRFNVKSMGNALAAGAFGALTVAIVCATAGIIIGILSLTGLGLKFSQLLITLSFGFMPLLLVLTMVAGLILGMGMTATSVYIVLAVLVAPALVSMGVQPIAAHLFVFYFGILSAITPPVAVASFAAASITKTSPMEVGWEGFKIGIAGFIIPFMLLYNPVLLWQGSPAEMLQTFFTTSIAIWALAGAIEGWLTRPINILFRVALIIGAILLIDPSTLTDLLGCIIIAALYFYAKMTLKTGHEDEHIDKEGNL